ncbi:MAG: hypothetical protein NC131_18380 [Roseburia sp.]|nr:hypothetical protein [Roseburia sp.]
MDKLNGRMGWKWGSRACVGKIFSGQGGRGLAVACLGQEGWNGVCEEEA